MKYALDQEKETKHQESYLKGTYQRIIKKLPYYNFNAIFHSSVFYERERFK